MVLLGPAINLDGPTLPKQNIFSRGLDFLSSTLLEPTTFIKSPSAAADLVRERRARIRTGDKTEAVDVIAEALTATGIAAATTLGVGTAAGRTALAKIGGKLLPTTIPKAVGAATIGGILISSGKARDIVSTFIDDPTKIGREGGKIIDKVAAGEDTGKIIDVIKTAGIVGGLAVATGGAVAVVKKLKSGKTAVPVTKLPSGVPIGTPIPNTQGPISQDNTPVITPTEKQSTPLPSVVVNNNIKINNKSSANRRFINNVNV